MKKLIIALLLAFPNLALAASATYTADVYVDVSADNGAIARANAMNIANRKALNTVLNRITTDDAIAKFDELSAEQIINFIQETSVVDEKASNIRYIANLQITINDSLLKDYMKEQGFPFINNVATDVVVIPVYRESPSSSPMLFDDNNIWLSSWYQKSIKASGATFNVMKAYTNVDVIDIVSLDPRTLDKIAKVNQINDIYIVEATNNYNHEFEVKITSAKTGMTETITISKDTPEYIDEALKTSVEKINNSLKKQKIDQGVQKNIAIIIYNYQSLKDWNQTEKSVRKIEQVNNLSTDAFNNGKVQFRVEYNGSSDNLLRAFDRNGLTLKQYDNIYLLEKKTY